MSSSPITSPKSFSPESESATVETQNESPRAIPSPALTEDNGSIHSLMERFSDDIDPLTTPADILSTESDSFNAVPLSTFTDANLYARRASGHSTLPGNNANNASKRFNDVMNRNGLEPSPEFASDQNHPSVINLDDDTLDERILDPLEYAAYKAKHSPNPPPPAYSTDSGGEEPSNIPGSPFVLSRSLSNTGIHKTAQGMHIDLPPQPKTTSAVSRHGRHLSTASTNFGEGTYAYPSGQMTPGMLESGSQAGSRPTTPKGHSMGSPSSFPLNLNLGLAANFGAKLGFPSSPTAESDTSSRESSNGIIGNISSPQLKADRMAGEKGLMGFLGGGGTGVQRGMKGSEIRSHRPFINEPTDPLARPDYGNNRSTSSSSFTSTLTYLTRVPRRFRPMLAGLVCFLLLGGMAFKWAGDRAEAAERAVAERHIKHMQKAFVISSSSSGDHLPDHPAKYLDSSLNDIVGISNHKGSSGKVDTSSPAVLTGLGYDGTPFKMNKAEEMAALVSFFTSTSSNALPKIDPSKQLEPQLVLDFDYSKKTAREDMAQLETDMWSTYPVILFGAMRDPYHREILKIMSGFVISPPPLIIELDQRSDMDTLIPLLTRLLSTDKLPQLVLGGKAGGTYKDIIAANDANHFKDLIMRANHGVSITEKKLKKKPKYIKDAERREKERIFGPKPIDEVVEEVSFEPEALKEI